MKIAVVAANGRAGSKIVKELIERNLDVTAVVKEENKTFATKVINKDLFDLTREDLKDFDVVVDAFGAWAPEIVHLHSDSLKHLADLLSGTEIRLVVVGGAGSLYVDEALTLKVMDTPDFPEMFLALARAQGKSYEELKERKDVKWTYVSPAGNFDFEGPKTGKFKVGGDQLILSSKGESYLTYSDYAIAFANEVQSGKNIQKRISVVSE